MVDLEVIKHNGLIEINGGIIEGKLTAESFKNYPLLADAWVNKPQDFYPEGGEHMRNAYERIYNTILELANENSRLTEPDTPLNDADHVGSLIYKIQNLKGQ